MGLRKVNRIARDVELLHAQEEKKDAHQAAKESNLTVGKRIRYQVQGVEHYGVIQQVLHPVIQAKGTRGDKLSKRIDKLVVELNGAGLIRGGEDLLIREDEISFADVVEVLGEGRVAQPQPSTPKRGLPPAPAREGGYPACDIGKCEQTPAKVYAIRKSDMKLLELGPMQLVALCREHDEPYEEAHGEGKTFVDATIPLIWKMGVVVNEFAVPKPKVTDEPPEWDETIGPGKWARSHPPAVKTTSDSPFEGKRGRHPLDCQCSKHGKNE